MTYNKKTIEDIDVSGKKVLVRCDFNVPLKDGVITSDKRIVEAVPTIKYLLSHGAAVILCSHMGKPKGQVNPKYTLAPVAARLTELLGQKVPLAPDTVGPETRKMATSSPAKLCCLRTPVLIPARRRTTPNLQKNLLLWLRSS